MIVIVNGWVYDGVNGVNWLVLWWLVRFTMVLTGCVKTIGCVNLLLLLTPTIYAKRGVNWLYKCSTYESFSCVNITNGVDWLC